MAKPKDDLSGLLSDIERTALIKKRAFAAPYWSPAERKALLKQAGELQATLEAKAIALGAPDEALVARTPRRRSRLKNGHVSRSA